MTACPSHGVETNLSCRTCATPVCADCAVRTPMGISCVPHAGRASDEAVVARQPRRQASGPGGRRLLAGGLLLMVVFAAGALLRSSGGDDGEDTAARWTALPAAGLAARGDHSVVWTGQAMIVWGGNGQAGPLNDGAAYAVPTSTWTPLAAAPLAPRRGHTAVWTGARMIVFGGLGRGEGCRQICALGDGAAYDPAADRWTPIAPAPLAARSGHTAVWVQDRMLVWGGAVEGGGAVADGAAYDPAADAWTPLPSAPLEARVSHRTVASGDRMLVWGGSSEAEEGGRYFADGAIYRLGTNSWARMAPYPQTRESPARDTFTSVWTGERMLVWGGYGRTESCRPCLHDDGAVYDADTDTWTLMSPSPLLGRGAHRAVWTGKEMIVWGGFNTTEQNDGATYNPVTDSWARLEPSILSPRQQHAMVWTGAQLLIWGGHGPHGVDAGATANHDDGAILRLSS